MNGQGFHGLAPADMSSEAYGEGGTGGIESGISDGSTAGPRE